MTTWYRVHTNRNPLYVFSGDGGLFVLGRWNHKGRKVIYSSESIALASMEWLAHNGLSVSGFNYYRYSIEIPEKFIRHYSIKELPKDWNFTPATDSSRNFSDTKLFAKGMPLAISVPSVIVPEEFNLVINPFHREFLTVASSIKNLGNFIAPIR